MIPTLHRGHPDRPALKAHWLVGLGAALVPALLAILVLIGWATANAGLKNLWLSRVTMNPVSAVCFVAVTASLLVRLLSGRVARLTMRGLLAVPMVVGGLIVADDMFHLGMRPDRILFRSQLATSDITGISRMAPNTAACFVLIGIAIVLAGQRRRSAIALSQVLAVIVACIAGFAIVGNVYGVTLLYGVGAFFPMAAHSATAFLASTVCLLITTRHGPAALLADKGAAGRALRRMLPATLASPVLIGGGALMIVKRAALPTDVVIALMVVANVLVMTSLVWLTGVRLFASDRRWRRAERELHRLARTDWLTGLPNRAAFVDTVLRRMSPDRRHTRGMFAVVYMDLDGFKAVNDTLGHAAGDQLLCDVGAHLRACVRPGDMIARLGGDEFTMLLDRISHPDDATVVAARIVAGMPTQVSAGGLTVPTGISIGIVVSESRHIALEDMLHEADQALYRAKRTGRGRFIVYTRETAFSPEVTQTAA